MVTDINDIGVTFTAYKQIQLAVLISGVLIYAFDSNCIIIKQISSAVDQSKGPMSNHFVQAVLLPILLLFNREKY